MAESINGTGQMLIRIQEGIADIQAIVRATRQDFISLERRMLAAERALVGLHDDMSGLRAQVADMDARLALRLDRIERAVEDKQ